MESPVPNGACGVKRSFSLYCLDCSHFVLCIRYCIVIVLAIALSACDGSESNSFSEALGQSSGSGQQIIPSTSAVNQPPQFEPGPDIHAVSTQGLVEVVDWVSSVNDGDNGQQRLQFETVSVSDPDLFIVSPWVSYPSLTLRFEPQPGVEGTAKVALRVKDDGGTANGGEDTSSTQSFLIHIETPENYVNHAPTFDAGPDISVTGSGEPFSMPGWAKNSDDGDGGHQHLDFEIVSNSRPDLFKVQPWVSYPSLTLRFTSKSCLAGTAKLGVILKDNGGTQFGGTDQSVVQYFKITIQCPNPNSSPAFDVGPDIVVPASIGDAEFPGWAKNVSDGDGGTQNLSFAIISNDNAGLFSRQPRVSYPSRTLRFTPFADAEGTAKLRIRLEDDGGTVNGGSDTSSTQTFYITITQTDEPPENKPPIASNIQTTTAFETAIDILLLGSDPDNDALTYELVETPVNGIVELVGDVAHYQPAVGYSGLDRFTYRVSDGELISEPAQVEINIEARKNTAPVAESIELSLLQGENLYFTLQGIDAENDPLEYYVLNQPDAGYLSGQLPNLEYTASAEFTGKLTFEYKVNDGLADSEIATVSLIIIPANQIPTTSDLFYSTDEGEPVEGVLQGSDIESEVLTYLIETAPQHGSLSGVFPDFVYSPDAGFNGNDSFSYKVFDGEGYSTVADVLITVYPVNDAPAAFPQTVSTPEETALNITLQGEDADLDSLSYLLVSQPENGTISLDNNLVVYTPADNFSGTDSFEFRISDGLAYSEAAVIIILVNSSNDRPIAYAQSHTISEDATLDITLTGSDPEGSPLSYQVVSQPAKGSLSGTPPQLTYSPNADFNGIDSFTYITHDGELSSEAASVTIDVTPENDAPIAESQSLSLDENTRVNIVLAGEDPDGDALKIHALSRPDHGTLVEQQDSWVFTPDQNFSGGDQFTFAVSDGYELSAPALVSIEVRPVNAAPVAGSADYQVSRNEQLVITLEGTDADSDELSYTLTRLPQYGSLEGQAPVFVYIPDNGYAGLDSLGFFVSDGIADSNLARVNIEVLPEANRAPVADAGTDLSGLVNHPIKLDGSGSSDEDGDLLTYQWAIVESPDNAGAGLSDESSVQPTFTANLPGLYIVELVVNDGELNSQPDYVSITISEPGSPPVADAGPDGSGISDIPLLLDGSASYATQEGRTLSYRWMIVDQPPGSNPVLSDSEATQPQFVADAVGTYRLSLIVKDGVESSVADETVLTISDGLVNTKPVARASFSIDYNEMEDISIYLDGSDSSDDDGDTLSYRWTVSNYHPDFPDRPQLDVVAPEWVSEPSDQLVELIVNDGYTDSDPYVFTIPSDASFTPYIDFDTTTISRDVGVEVPLSVFVQDHDFYGLGHEWMLLEQPVSSTTDIADPLSSDTTLLLDAPGKYIVGISVDDGTPNGQVSLQKIIFATLASNQRPVADAGTGRTLDLVSPPQRIVLDGTASYDPDGDPLAFHWDLNVPFGSLAKLNDSTLPQPTFSPDVPGEYLLSLRVDDGEALSDDHEIEIEVERSSGNETPVADAGADFGAETFTEIQLNGTASSDPDGDAVGFFWRVVGKPQGSTAAFPSDQAGKSTPVFTPDLPGTYIIHLTVNDFESVSAPDILTITVSEKNRFPVADTRQTPGEYETLNTGQKITVDGSNSYDPEGESLTYAWTVLQKPESSGADLSSIDTPTTEFTPDVQGYYQLGLKVNDGQLDSAYGLYSIRAYDAGNQAPVAVVGEPITDFIDTIIYLDGSHAYDPDGDELVSRRWQLVVGPNGANIQVVAPWDESPWFTGDKPGTYLIGYAVSDGQLLSDVVFQHVTLIGSTPPIAHAGDDFASRVFDPVQLEGRNSIDPDGDDLTFHWQLLQQPTSSSAYLQDADTSQARLVGDTVGQYTVQLQVADGYTTTSDTVIVTLVPNRAPVADAGAGQAVQVGAVVALEGSNSSDPDGDDITWDVVVDQ